MARLYAAWSSRRSCASACSGRSWPSGTAPSARSAVATQRRELLQGSPVLRRSIRLRNPYVDPLSLVQVSLLRRWRDGSEPDAEEAQLAALAVNGIAAGLQNTG